MKKRFIIFILIFLCKVMFSQNDTLQLNMIYKVYRYQNNKISSEGFLKDNKPTGFWKSYYITGIIKSEGRWHNNKLDSIWIFYDQLGDTIEKINYYQGKKNGYQYKYFTNNNKIALKELYVDGLRNDKSYYYYENEILKKIIPYLKDKKNGMGFEYDMNGNIITINRYRNNDLIDKEDINRFDNKGKKEGVWKIFYENEILKEEKNYLEGKLNGYFKLYNNEGKLISAVKYNNGEVDLKTNEIESNLEIKEEYDKNGNIIFQGSYKENIPIGIHRYFNYKGKIIKSITYDVLGKVIGEGIVFINGNEDGDWIYYYENGNKSAEGKFINGKKNGKWSYFYPNGKLQQTGSYTTGKLTGIWEWYYETGKHLKKEFYIYDKLDGEIIEYDELGNIISKGNYIEGCKEGEWIYNIGDQSHIGKYVTDLKDGVWKSFYNKEKTLSFEGRYLQGNPDGKHSYYLNDGKLIEERYYKEGKMVKSWSKYNIKGDLILVVQYKDGKEYKINGVKVKLDDNEN